MPILVGISISTLTNTGIFQKAEDTKSARWKIFYADTNNIYLIAGDYIEPSKLPTSTNENESSITNKINITENGYHKAVYFTNILNDYSGVHQEYIRKQFKN